MLNVLGILILGIVLTVFISLIVYITIYNLKINKQLKQGNTEGRQWPAPKNVVLAVVFVVLSVLVSVNGGSENNEPQTYSVNQYTDYVCYTSDEIRGTMYEHYTKAFETGQLAGYEKVEKTENDFHYMYFISKDYDILHPAFVLFVEYVGEATVSGYMDECRIYTSEESSWGSGGGGESADYYCVIGNMDFHKINGFSYELGVYTEYGKIEGKEEETDGMNGSVAKINIWID